MVSADFQQAYDNAKNLKGASDEEMLKLYAYNKVARGEDITKAPKPGMLDFAGKQKRKEWEKVANSGISAEEADQKYVETFNELKEKHGLK